MKLKLSDKLSVDLEYLEGLGFLKEQKDLIYSPFSRKNRKLTSRINFQI